LRPADGINDGRDLLRETVFANGRVQIGGFEELILGNASDALDDLRRVALVLLLQKLEDAARMLEREIVGNPGRQRGGWRGGGAASLRSHGACSLITVTFTALGIVGCVAFRGFLIRGARRNR